MRAVILTAAVATSLVLILVVFALILQGTQAVSANGATRAVVKDVKVGPYQMAVGILPGNPKVGNLHLSVLVQDAETTAGVSDAILMVMAKGPVGATHVMPVQALNTPQNPQFYDVDISLDMEGRWILTLEMDSELGKASLDVPLEVTESGGFNLVWMAAGAVAVLALAFWGWGKFWPRRRPRQQQS